MKLTARQERALLALLGEASVTSAAKVAKVGERTLRRWLTLPAFAKAYQAVRRESFERATARLQQAPTEAVTALVEVMRDADAKDASRIAAARTVLEEARRAAELDDLADRVADLEVLAPSWGRRHP